MAGFRITGKTQGLDQFRGALANVGKKVRSKLLRSGMTAAGQVVLQAARRGSFADRTGLLRKILGKKLKSYQSGAVWVAVVGPQTGFKTSKKGGIRKRERTSLGKRFLQAGVNPVYYAHLIEGGVAPHTLGKGSRLYIGRGAKKRLGPQVGRMHPGFAARPFLRPALENNASAVTTVLGQILGDGIEAAAKGG